MPPEITEVLQKNFPLVAASASLAIATAKYGPVAVRMVKSMMKLYRALEAISELPPKVDRLFAEIQPNGGASLRDAIDSLAERHMTRWKLAYGTASWESDEKGRCVAANTDLCTLVDMDEDDILGYNWKNFIHQDDQERVFREWKRTVEDGSDFRLDCRYVRPDKTVIPVLLTARAMRRNGRVFGWIGKADTR